MVFVQPCIGSKKNRIVFTSIQIFFITKANLLIINVKRIILQLKQIKKSLQPISKYSEEELVILLRAQDQSAFSYLYDNYAAALNGIIIRMVDDTQLAEDILQEAFLKIWNNFKQYDTSKGRLFTWMIFGTNN